MVDGVKNIHSVLRATLLSLFIVFMAFLARYFLLDRLGDRFIWSSFYPAVILAALFGGWYQGLLASIVSVLIVASIFFAGPEAVDRKEEIRIEVMGTLVFLYNSLLVSWVADRIKKLSDKNRQTLHELEERNARWHAINENLPESFIYQTSTDGKGAPLFLYISEGIGNYIRGGANEVLSKPDRLLEIIYEEDRPLFMESRSKALKETSPLDLIVRYRSLSGEIRWAHIRSKPRITSEGMKVWDGLFTDITERRKLEKQLEEQILFNQRLITELVIRENETERKKMARELHEDINQILAGAKIYLDLSRKDGHQNPGLLQESSDMIKLAMRKINALFDTLGDPGIEGFGFRDSLELVMEELNKNSKLEVTLEFMQEGPDRQSPQSRTILLQITRSLITRMEKQLHATKILLSLRLNEKNISIQALSNLANCTSQPELWAEELKLIKNRIDFYRGSLVNRQVTGKGCMVEIELPVDSFLLLTAV